jgi:RimJ/RimL family protein N-acetyltransferase
MRLVLPDEIPTRRLVLRRWRESDAPQLKAAIDASLAQLQQWMPWAMAEPSPLEVIQQRITKFEAQFDAGEEWLFAIRSGSTGVVLGGAGLHARIGPDGLEIGYWLAADATGKGFATEAAAALTRAALRQPGIQRVQIRCDPLNVASAAVPRRLGYHHRLTILGETLTSSGAPRDTMVWETTRQEMTARAAGEEL